MKSWYMAAFFFASVTSFLFSSGNLVFLAAERLLVSKYEITASEFAQFLLDSHYTPSSQISFEGSTDPDGKSRLYWSSPEMFRDDFHPAVFVSWYDALEYCNWKSVKENLIPCYHIDRSEMDPDNHDEFDTAKWPVMLDKNANGYRLPTKAEWISFADNDNVGLYTDDYENNIWCRENSAGESHVVGEKNPNIFGLYDTMGNVFEWCWDMEPWSSQRTCCGCCWDTAIQSFPGNTLNRMSALYGSVYVGFRVVRSKG